MRIPDEVLRELIGHERFGHYERLVWLVCWSHCPASLSELSCSCRVDRHATAKAARVLGQHGWMRVVREGRGLRPIATIPHNCQLLLAVQLREDYKHATHKGEFLMKRYLDLRINSDRFVDNARPIFLTSPLTDEQLEYDRYYPKYEVAFEFNGAQHLELTEDFPEEKALRDVKTRDTLKLGLSTRHGVTLITITADQLHPAVLEILIPPDLPRRPLDTQGPYYRALVSLCTRYVRSAKEAAKARRSAPASNRGKA